MKWFWVLVCLGFGGIFIIADSPVEPIDHRSHIVLTMVGVLIFAGAYALQVFSSSCKAFNTALAKSIGVSLIVLTAFGAQLGVERIVYSRKDQLDFIRTELSRKSPSQYRKIVVVWSPSDVTNGRWHETRKGRYEYVMVTLGIVPKSKQIIFVNSYPERAAEEDELIVDWNKYITARDSPQQRSYNSTCE